MEPYCTLKAARHLFQNKGCFHHNANDRFGLKVSQTLHSEVILLGKKDKKLFVYFVFFLLIRTFVM